ncbi:hypothetical protein EIN_355640 [Entamoeba invadens IP1]|uniref:Uncharacterized protein n=1 Tax=Entamoeba invadens IP1 TaxID=370355 RepID=L7FN33_ENTIV|nr:hypothetical protein EIN_355640 [Entamoeba invadens IP1]ELP92543.1 hypothetical protein EIN_355640 [Entamoeba invadens IP1]|eukprot:XP_004259314.1 hypothetical protein EIN_355640 [Entamoeba invadens IP1]
MAEQLFQVIKKRMTLFVIGKIKTFVVLSVRDNLLFWLFDGFLGLDPDKYKQLFNFSEEAPRKQVAEMYLQHAVCEQNYINLNICIFNYLINNFLFSIFRYLLGKNIILVIFSRIKKTKINLTC